MKLLTAELKKKLPPLYTNEHVATEDQIVIVKFFAPWNNWTWYATEFDGEDTFFGLVEGQEKEWGYFSLSELEAVRGRWGLKIERDMYWTPKAIKDIQ